MIDGAASDARGRLNSVSAIRCAMAPVIILIASASVISVLTTTLAVDKEVDLGLEAVQPINKVICVVELAKPHIADIQAAIAAFCANLPDSVSSILVQAAAAAVAIEGEKVATAERAAPQGPSGTLRPSGHHGVHQDPIPQKISDISKH